MNPTLNPNGHSITHNALDDSRFNRARRKPHARLSGITLVEMMVIVTIVVLLITLILPALAAARQSTYSMVCKSNMRQCTVTTLSYTMENKQYFPVSSNDTYAPYSNYTRWVDLVDGTEPSSAAAATTNYKPRQCPGTYNLAFNSTTTSFGDPSTVFTGGNGYPTNHLEAAPYLFKPNNNICPRFDHFMTSAPAPSLVRMNSIGKKFNLIMLLIDSGGSTSDATNGQLDNQYVGGYDESQWVRFRHNYGNSINLSFLEGHVESWNRADVMNAYNIGNPIVHTYHPDPTTIPVNHLLQSTSPCGWYPWGFSLE